MHKKSWAWVLKSDMGTICILIKPKKALKLKYEKKIKRTIRYLRINYSAGWKQTRSSLQHLKINNKQNPYTNWYTNIPVDKEMYFFNNKQWTCMLRNCASNLEKYISVSLFIYCIYFPFYYTFIYLSCFRYDKKYGTHDT